MIKHVSLQSPLLTVQSVQNTGSQF